MNQIEAEQTSSELARLKAQINPHFLFNTLNGIYGLALTKSDKTAEYLLKLSSIMRYTLSETSSEKVPLENEINYLHNYIALQKIRLTETTRIDFTVTGNIDAQQIPPLLFINFIENAFKYGVSNEVETEIKIHLIIEENKITLCVKNAKINQNHVSSSNEIGLMNIKRRLDLIFENNYKLEIENTEKTFEVNLMIKQ
ncbi:MAG: sensor histidine kinase [Methylotenera sp.]|nr:sensor histidine kinase [Flavobacterium sp.]